MNKTRTSGWLTIGVAAVLACGPVLAGSHTWDVWEVFSDAAVATAPGGGICQFVELFEADGGANEVGVNGHHVTSNSSDYIIPGPALPAGTTANKSLLLATAACTALPGFPTPNYTLPVTWSFSTAGDTVTYVAWDALAFGAVPTDGLNSMNEGVGSAMATPTNYADDAWLPPAVPETVRASKIAGFPDGSRLSIEYDIDSCGSNPDHMIIYGFGSQLPAAPGGIYNLSGSRCNMGRISPVVWSGVPDPSGDPSGYLWFVVLAETRPGATNTNASEGSWGTDSGGGERTGPGVGGMSAQCLVDFKSLTNACGL
jgi:hypothetical protein